MPALQFYVLERDLVSGRRTMWIYDEVNLIEMGLYLLNQILNGLHEQRNTLWRNTCLFLVASNLIEIE
jgi:hypothetical protein